MTGGRAGPAGRRQHTEEDMGATSPRIISRRDATQEDAVVHALSEDEALMGKDLNSFGTASNQSVRRVIPRVATMPRNMHQLNQTLGLQSKKK